MKSYRATFFNASFGNILSRISYYSPFAFLLTEMASEITEHPGFDIVEMCAWIENDDSDILMISEVPAGEPLGIIIDFLHTHGYKTHSTATLEFWSHTPEYCLCQVTAYKCEPENIREQSFFQKYSVLYAFFYSLVGAHRSGKLSTGKKIYKRLRRGVRDGAITVLEYGDHSIFLSHIHHWGKDIESYMSSILGATEKPAILMGDINLDNASKLLARKFFKKSTAQWKDLFGHMGRTFGFPEPYYPLWMRLCIYKSPDIVVGRAITLECAENIISLSDHNRIVVKYGVEE